MTVVFCERDDCRYHVKAEAETWICGKGTISLSETYAQCDNMNIEA